jgi:hypothetical protein
MEDYIENIIKLTKIYQEWIINGCVFDGEIPNESELLTKNMDIIKDFINDINTKYDIFLKQYDNIPDTFLNFYSNNTASFSTSSQTPDKKFKYILMLVNKFYKSYIKTLFSVFEFVSNFNINTDNEPKFIKLKKILTVLYDDILNLSVSRDIINDNFKRFGQPIKTNGLI